MLNPQDFGYAVMSKDLQGIGFDGNSLENCKRYCRNDDVIVERIPVVNGFSFKIAFYPWFEKFSKHKLKGFISIWFLCFNFVVKFEYRHKIGKIVYRPEVIE
jgi:hypothetical protein